MNSARLNQRNFNCEIKLYKFLLLSFYFFASAVLLISCSDDDLILGPNNNSCFVFDDESHTGSEFLIFHEGNQKGGIAKGIKINRNWESSVRVTRIANNTNITLTTYYLEEVPNDTLLSERIDIQGLTDSLLIEGNCLDLTHSVTTPDDSIIATYRLFHGDSPFKTKYELDEAADNKIEISEYEESTGLFEIFFKATFISNNPIEPEFPARVRFYDVVIHNNL